ncbi:MAG: hypothetical protein Q4D82_05140 [Neisseria sp.]|nr:hypothetical protein [Neisseria sp.]
MRNHDSGASQLIGWLWQGVAFIIIVLPFYAAIKDFLRGEIAWAILDILTVVVGDIRGLMYFFGGLQ